MCAYYASEWPVLVVCPSSLRFNWRDEFVKWLGIPASDINIMLSGADGIRGRVCIISYDLVHKHRDALLAAHFQLVICDEAHYLKSIDAKRTTSTLPLVKQARRALFLTGTPALSRPAELFTQVHALAPRMFPTMRSFGLRYGDYHFPSTITMIVSVPDVLIPNFLLVSVEGVPQPRRYCNGRRGKFGWDYSGSSNLLELHALLTTYIMIRRLKADVLSELAAKTRQTIAFDIQNAALQSALRELREQYRSRHVDALLDAAAAAAAATAAATGPATTTTNGVIVVSDPLMASSPSVGQSFNAALLKLYHDSAVAKLPAIDEYLTDFLASNHDKFLVYAHHQVVLDALQAIAEREGVAFVRIDGQTDARLRHRAVDQFQTDPRVRMAILSITAASQGKREGRH